MNSEEFGTSRETVIIHLASKEALRIAREILEITLDKPRAVKLIYETNGQIIVVEEQSN